MVNIPAKQVCFRRYCLKNKSVLLKGKSLWTMHTIDWLLSLKQFLINVSYNILVASLTLMVSHQS